MPNFVVSEGSGCYAVSFTPQVLENHIVQVRFNSQQVPGSPFTLEMEGSDVMYPADSGVIRVPVGRPAVLAIDPRRTDMRDVIEQMTVDVVGESSHKQ